MFGQDPGHTGEIRGTSLFGPLVRQWKFDAGHTMAAPLIADGKVIAAWSEGSGGWHGVGRTRWAVRFHFPPVRRRVGRRDVVAIRVRGLARAGWGFPDAFQRGCGKRRMRYRP